MKSAYEKALERLERESGPTRTLTEQQKARIADIDRRCDAQIAEQKIAYESKILNASTPAELNEIRAELANQLAAIESRREKEKESVWNEAGS